MEPAGPFQVVFFADVLADEGLKLEGFTRFGVVRRHFRDEVHELVHGASDGAHLLPAIRHRGEAGDLVEAASIAGQFEECPAQHDVGVVVGHFLIHRLGLSPLGGEVDDARFPFRWVDLALLDHPLDRSPCHVSFVHAGVAAGGGVESAAEGGVAILVVERLQAAFEGVHRVIVRFPEWNLAAEGPSVANGPVVADESLQHEVVDGLAVAVDGRLRDVLVAELVAADDDVVHVRRAVPALDDAILVGNGCFVSHAGDCVAADEFVGGVVGDEGCGGLADGEELVNSVVSFFDGEAEAVLAVGTEDIGETGEDLLVGEHLEQLRGEAVGAVIGTEAGPEPLAGDGSFAINLHEPDLPFGLFGDVEVVDVGFPVGHVADCGGSHCVLQVRGAEIWCILAPSNTVVNIPPIPERIGGIVSGVSRG